MECRTADYVIRNLQIRPLAALQIPAVRCLETCNIIHSVHCMNRANLYRRLMVVPMSVTLFITFWSL